ncbi:hypothetical protein HSX11_23465 [Oxalobacteraceae bacterium]|nr:hypothetical protein [Oxalobacteraceae bacterium]
MNYSLLNIRARELKDILSHYATIDKEAINLLSALEPLIEKSIAGEILAPYEWRAVPGSYYFTEGTLRKFPELESAYSKFTIELTGGETPVLKKLRAQMKK